MRTGCLLAILCAISMDAQTIPKRTIEERDGHSNGILVDAPKTYDDSLLQQMLAAAQSRLTSLQIIDQASILSHLGAITGATQQIAGVAVNGQSLPLPQVATTANGATNTTATTTGSSGAVTQAVNTIGQPATNVVTTAPQVSPPSATAPAATTSLPSSFSVSASDLLNEQVQLTSEIANLRLLLEGSLNDWFQSPMTVRVKGQTKTVNSVDAKTRVTVGIPITISANKRYKGAVAIVEALVEARPMYHGAPAVTALLPREKTYNVAAITDHSASIGAGFVTGLAGVAGSFLWGHKTYYVVKDQDTVARMVPPDQPTQTAFLWEFRPVLGQSFVQAGLKQTFVQLAFDKPGAAGVVGAIKIRTYWRRYDRKTGMLKDVIDDPHEYDFKNIYNFELKPDLAGVGVNDLEDLGGGQMLVTVPGRFLDGSYVRVGSSILTPGSTGFTFEYRLIRFQASIADLATKRVVLVSRDGNETDILVHEDPARPVDFVNPPTVTPLDDTNSLLQIPLKPGVYNPLRPLVVVIGGKVYGYSDAPLTVTGNTLSIALPTSFLISNATLTVMPLLADPDLARNATLFPARTEGDRLVLVSQTSATVTYLLLGRGLAGITVASPTGITPQSVGAGAGVDPDAMALITLSVDNAKNIKQLLLQRPGERPFAVALPALPAAGTSSTDQTPKFAERVTVGADEATINGDGLNTVTSVLFGKTALTITDKSAKQIKIKGLAAAGATTVARTQDISLVSASGTVKMTLEVVNEKVETVAK